MVWEEEMSLVGVTAMWNFTAFQTSLLLGLGRCCGTVEGGNTGAHSISKTAQSACSDPCNKSGVGCTHACEQHFRPECLWPRWAWLKVASCSLTYAQRVKCARECRLWVFCTCCWNCQNCVLLESFATLCRRGHTLGYELLTWFA